MKKFSRMRDSNRLRTKFLDAPHDQLFLKITSSNFIIDLNEEGEKNG